MSVNIIIFNYNIIMMKVASNICNFSLTKSCRFFFTKFLVNNPTTGKPCAEFNKFEGQAEMREQSKLIRQGRAKWNLLNIEERKTKMKLFVDALQANKQKVIDKLQSSTGKHRQVSTLQMQAALSMLRRDLQQEYPGVTQKKSGSYYFKQSGHILVVSDYRTVILNSLKYLISCGIAGNSMILNPHRYGLPAIKKIEQIWRNTLPSYPLVYCPVNNFTDGLEYLVQKKNLGFVSYSGDIDAGNSFYHFMAQKSEILAESEFLLMSSDSAYILKDLNVDQIKIAAQNLVKASFIGGGNLFNSVKRIFVDSQISQPFTQFFIQQSKKYNISVEGSKASPIITANHIDESKKLIKQLEQYQGQELKLLTSVETKQCYKSFFISPMIFKVDGIPTFEYWNKIFPMPVCFIQSVFSEQTAIQNINSSIYGISATIFTNDKAKIEQLGKKLDVGVVYGNRWGFIPGVPYSPRKRSGKGYSFSIKSYTNITKSQSLKGLFLLQ